MATINNGKWRFKAMPNLFQATNFITNQEFREIYSLNSYYDLQVRYENGEYYIYYDEDTFYNSARGEWDGDEHRFIEILEDVEMLDEDYGYFNAIAEQVYEIRFESNGGTQIEIKYDNNLGTLPIPKKYGYHFLGWFYDQELTNQAFDDDVINQDYTLFAKWEDVQVSGHHKVIHEDFGTDMYFEFDESGYFISNDVNYFSIKIENGNLYYDATIVYSDALGEWLNDEYKKLNIPNLTPLTYEFKQWFDDNTTPIYAIHYIDNTTQQINEIIYDNEIAYLPQLASDRFIFVNWLYVDNTIVNLYDVVSNDIEIYAHFTEQSFISGEFLFDNMLAINSTIRFDTRITWGQDRTHSNDFIELKPQQLYYGSNLVYNNGWVNDDYRYVEFSGVTIVDEFKQLLNSYAERRYVLSYETFGGTTYETEYFKKTITSLPTPTKTGLFFDAWYFENSFKNEVAIGDNLSSDTTIYARFYLADTFSIYLYNNNAERNKVDKTNELVYIGVIDGVLRQSCSIQQPVIVIEYATLPIFNYVNIPIFNRYYYVSDILSISKNIWQITLNCDVLMSYKEQILNLECVVERSESERDENIVDNQMVDIHKDVVEYVDVIQPQTKIRSDYATRNNYLLLGVK